MSYFQTKTSSAPLAVFRITTGLLLFGGICRFWSKGWIQDLYIAPKYFFPFYSFEFVKPLGQFTYLLFALCGISALLVAVGFYYRLAAICLFLSFTYIELIDKSTYLNHYYFTSLICMLLVFLPANVNFSIDAYRNRNLLAGRIPKWNIDSIKLLVFILYFYAGIAKLNSDWLIHALPLKIWLPARNDTPIIGSLFNSPFVAHALSWFGCAYDLTIVFFLLNRRTRPFAYITVVIFHAMTAILFPIGMFPYIMIFTALIFFSAEFHELLLQGIGSFLKMPATFLFPKRSYSHTNVSNLFLTGILGLFFVFQIAFPFRYMLYPDELFWTEEGYRFSWRVMLMEKAGYAQFTIRDASGKMKVVNNNEFLTTLQEKMMATQPDMLLQYAHMLRDYYSKKGFRSPQVYVDSYVSLNGRLGQTFIEPSVDLSKITESFRHKSWIAPLHDEIKGF